VFLLNYVSQIVTFAGSWNGFDGFQRPLCTTECVSYISIAFVIECIKHRSVEFH
jgi:hypothetical protein